jgi:hypothetical protein
MATLIKETPILKGKDASKFILQMNATQQAITNPKEKERILKNYKKLQSIAKFQG